MVSDGVSERAGETAGADRRSAGLARLIEAKLWRNPCWFAFRFNYLALRYNTPLYAWVQRAHGLSRPEFTVIYALGLVGEALARDIAANSGFPANTLSRAIHKLADLGLIDRRPDPTDRRNHLLSLTEAGATVFEDALPRFVDFERRILAPLTEAERGTLSALMAKIVMDSDSWPGIEDPLDLDPLDAGGFPDDGPIDERTRGCA